MSHQEFFQELKKDHQELTELIQQMKSEPSSDSKDMVMQLKRDLVPHQEAEEKTFYQSLQKLPTAHRLAFKAEEEHHVAEAVLSDLEKTPPGDTWTAKLDVLDELVQEHIKEEESRAFEAASSITTAEIDEILQNFQRMKLQIKSDMSKQPEEPSGADMYQNATQPGINESSTEPKKYDKPTEEDLGPKSGDLPNEDLGRVV